MKARIVLMVMALAACEDVSGPLTQPSAAYVPSGKELDVTYCTPGGQPLTMDIYYPPAKAPKPAPALMFIHGGQWVGGNEDSSVGMYDVPRFQKNGYFVASINYRVGKNIFPAYVEDAACAIAHLKHNALLYQLDPSRIGIWGHSAGGHIAAITALTVPGIKAVATYAAPFVLSELGDFRGSVAAELPSTFVDLVAASATSFVVPNAPPFMIVHGTLDESVEIAQAYRMQVALAAAGDSVQLLVVKNGGHYLTRPSAYQDSVASPTRLAISNAVLSFFNATVK